MAQAGNTTPAASDAGWPGVASFSASDEPGYKPANVPVTTLDSHATALRLLRLDHERLTFCPNGIDRWLKDVHGRVIQALFASALGFWVAAEPRGAALLPFPRGCNRGTVSAPIRNSCQRCTAW